MTRFRASPFLIIASILIAFIAIGSWIGRESLHAFASLHPALYVGIFTGVTVLLITFAIILALEGTGLKRTWLERSASVIQLDQLRPEPFTTSILKLIPDPFEILSEPIYRTPLGQQLRTEWIDAELGGKASRYLLLLGVFALGGYTMGTRVGGELLGMALFIMVPLLPRAFVRNRAENQRNRFQEQLPQVLDAIASGLSAGLSLQGAVEYALPELPQPSRAAFQTLSRRMSLGIPVEEALTRLQDDVKEEALSLAVDGLILQRQFGGDMVQMLEETAGLIRERLELEREVRAITSQGRLSGIVIAALVPVSAGFLLSFNPRYIDVLFDNVIGQGLVILALTLQLVGWAIISRLVRFQY